MKTYSASTEGDSFQRIGCDICGTTGYRLAMLTDEYRFVRCAGCGVTYQNPQPTAESLLRRYGAQYFSYEIENERNFFSLMLLGLADIDFHNLSGLDRSRGFLDIGCATGMLLEHMRDLGWRTKGVELCRESAEHGIRTRDLDIHVGDLQDAGFPDHSFGVVHFSHLLEHVRRPRAFLQEVLRLLPPEGYAVITTPNIAGLQARLFRTRWRSAIADHLYLFSRRTLISLLEDVGFRVEKMVTWGGLAAGTAPTLIKRPVDTLAKKLGFGDVVLVLARPGIG